MCWDTNWEIKNTHSSNSAKSNSWRAIRSFNSPEYTTKDELAKNGGGEENRTPVQETLDKQVFTDLFCLMFEETEKSRQTKTFQPQSSYTWSWLLNQKSALYSGYM